MWVVLVNGEPTTRRGYIRHYKTFETAEKYALEIVASYENKTVPKPSVSVAELDFVNMVEI